MKCASSARAIGFLAHEPLVYRELTPLENLELYGRLYRVPERRERIGMLLERFGLWEERHARVATFSRGMQQRLALCRTLLHDPQLVLLDEPFSGLDVEAAALVDRELRDLAGEHRTLVVSTHAPERLDPLGPPPPGARSVTGYFGDVAALARKDLLLELRSRDTVPAMLLFVVASLVVFHFALPTEASARATDGLLWIGILFTALLGLTRAFVAEREGSVMDGLVLATFDRSAIWLGKTLSVLAFLGAGRGGRAAGLRALLPAGRLGAPRRRRARRHRHRRRRHAALGDGGREPGARAAAAAALPAARHSRDRRRRGRYRG